MLSDGEDALMCVCVIMNVRACVFVYVCAYVCLCICVYACVCVCLCTCVHINTGVLEKPGAGRILLCEASSKETKVGISSFPVQMWLRWPIQTRNSFRDQRF